MIVRVLGEGQFDLTDEALGSLNDLDEALERAVEAGNEAAFAEALEALVDAVRTAGEPHDNDTLDESDVIIPGPDSSLDEVRELLAAGDGDGLIPG